MMQHEKPDDWVLATGESHKVSEFAELAFKAVGLDWSEYVQTSEKYLRPNEVDYLLRVLKSTKGIRVKCKTSLQNL